MKNQTYQWLKERMQELVRNAKYHYDAFWVKVSANAVEITALEGINHKPADKATFTYPAGTTKMDIFDAIDQMNGVKNVLDPLAYLYTVWVNNIK